MTTSTGRGALSSVTPQPTKLLRAKWRVLIEPPVRVRSALDDLPSNTGQVLDTRFGTCMFWQRWYSVERREVGMLRRSCGRMTCPACVVDWSTKLVAPAWAYWNGSAERAEFASGVDWRMASRSNRGLMRGANAVPGVLRLPRTDGGTVLWAPQETLDGALKVTGTQLDALVVGDVRNVPILEYVPKAKAEGGRSDAFGAASDWDIDQRVARAAAAAGFHLSVNGRTRATADHVSEEQNAIFVRVLMDR
ncbi:MAG: hypothetical protein WEA10_04925 [Actinomycetota bacterium]